MELQELKILAEDIRNRNPAGKRIFWSDEFKKQTIDLISHGQSVASISRSTGISVSNIYGWKYSDGQKQKKQFKQIKVTNKESQDLLLSWEVGLSIKGLSYAQIKELLIEGLL